MLRSIRAVRTVATAACATLVVAGAAMAVSNAGAVSSAPAPADSTGTSSHQATSTLRVSAEDYWTPERMRAAQPVKGQGSSSTKQDTPKAPKSVGRLFFKDGKKDMYCTASSITSKFLNAAITAGECLHRGNGDRDKGWYSDWVFVPAYDNGKAPHGKWKVDHMRVRNYWIDKKDRTYNVGIFNVFHLNGKKLNNVVGGNGLLIGSKPVQQDMNVWGYSSEENNGESVKVCEGDTVASTSWKGAAEMQCDKTNGFQGGPWIVADRRKPDTGYLFGITAEVALVGDKEFITALPFFDWIKSDLDLMPDTK